MHTPNTPNSVFINASCVHESATALRSIADAGSPITHIEGAHMISSTVLVCFALELFLKHIHSALGADDSFPGGHSLVSLYKSIPDEAVKNSISDKFEKKFQTKVDDFLEVHKDSFVNWRYFCENLAQLTFEPNRAFELAGILKEEGKSLI